MNGPRDNLKDDPRLTAFALGELDETERSAIAEQIALDPSLAALVTEIRAEATWLTGQLADEASPGLDVARRAAILAAVPAPQRDARVGTRPAHRARRGARWAAALGVISSIGVAATALFVVADRAPGVSVSTPRPVAAADPAGPSPVITVLPQGSASSGAPVALVLEPVAGAKPDDNGELRRHRFGDDEGRSGTLSVDPRAGASLRSGEGLDGHIGGALHDGRFGYKGTSAEPDLAEPASAERYRTVDESGFVRTADQPETTFSIDVDTASYSNVRRFLQQGQLPPPAAVRVEELVNYFPYRLPPPVDGRPIAIHVDVTDAPWDPSHLIARVGLKGKELGGDRGRANLVFLIDVSGSMQTANRLPLVKKSLGLLVKELRPDDTVAIVVYAGASGVALRPTAAKFADRISAAIDDLESGGSTNGSGGIRLAYEVARGAFVQGGINRVILATDGDFNVGITDRGELESLIEREAKSNVFLTVLGFGMGNLDDATLETLADRGNGNYAYVDRLAEAKKVLVNELGATMVAVAKDVKVQLELNPAKVAAYRLIGYENRRLANRDFADDTKDAGEMGAGHSVTMLYELVPASGNTEAEVRRYQRTLTEAARSGELFTVRVRYKEPSADVSQLLERPVHESSGHFQGGSEDLRFTTAVAAFGLLLKGSRQIPSLSYEQVAVWADGARGYDPGGWRREMVELALTAGRISNRTRAISSGE